MQQYRHGLSFGDAVAALNDGECVRRSSWQNDDLFVFRQVPSTIPAKVVPVMTSLPQKVKDFFQATFDNPNEQINSIYYSDQLALVHKSNLITGYSPSPSDALATDWAILII